MASRLTSAFLGLILLVVVLALPAAYFNIVIAVVALLALYELYGAFRTSGLKPVVWVGYFSVIYILFCGMIRTLNDLWLMNIVFASALLILFLHMILSSNKINFIDISVTIFGIIYITILLSFVVLTRNMENGNLLIWLILIGGWVTDSAAYFAGRFMGKNKLTPDLSPKKTVEGSIGGTVVCTLVIFAYGLTINSLYNINIPLIHYILLGIITSSISQVGDLVASAIKRSTGIKDFGNIMPGHGGVIDRFDSILLAAPAVYYYLQIIL